MSTVHTSNSKFVPSKEELHKAHDLLNGSKFISVPDVVLELNEQLSVTEQDIDRVVHLVSQDHAITRDVLKTVNSAMFGLNCKIESIRQMVELLGIQPLRNLVVAAAFKNSFRVKSPAAKSLWKDNLEVAKCAMRIASNIDGLSPDEAYLVGLLIDCGAILLTEKDPSYADFFETQTDHPISIMERESSEFGTNHAVIGYLFARHWKLEESHCLAIYLHHRSSCEVIQDAKLRAMIAVLRVASHTVAQRYVEQNERSVESIRYWVQAKNELKLSEDAISSLRHEALRGFA